MLNPASFERKKDCLKQITEDSSSAPSAGKSSAGRNEVKTGIFIFKLTFSPNCLEGKKKNPIFAYIFKSVRGVIINNYLYVCQNNKAILRYAPCCLSEPS